MRLSLFSMLFAAFLIITGSTRIYLFYLVVVGDGGGGASNGLSSAFFTVSPSNIFFKYSSLLNLSPDFFFSINLCSGLMYHLL
jgi:hypothetical protein